MIPKGLFTQIIMLIAAVSIVITYIQPKFQEIGQTQDDIAVYQEQRKKIVDVNARLASLVSTMEAVPSPDKERLSNYLPDEVDEIAIVRDLFFISQRAGVIYVDADYLSGNKDKREATEKGKPNVHTFELQVEATYDQIKDLLALLETNEYPFDIVEMGISGAEDSVLLKVSMTLNTYSYNNADLN